MAEINKIRVNKEEFDIVPQLGTGLYAENGIVSIDMGDGIAYDKAGRVCINLGTGLSCDEQKGNLLVNFGTAQVVDISNTECGIAIDERGFVIDSEKFKSFLVSLGVEFKQPQ